MLSVVVWSITVYLLLCCVSLCGALQFIYCYAECCYDECHYAECRYAECRGAMEPIDLIISKMHQRLKQK
jgi:hypothetical protein